MAIEITSSKEQPGLRPVFGRAKAALKLTSQSIWRKRRLILRFTLAGLILIAGAALLFLVFSYRSYSKIVDARLARGYLTSRAGIYAAPRTLRAGQRLSRDALVSLLRRAG